MKIQGKVWGETRTLYADSNVEVHYIKVKEGGYCSRHYHKTKYNCFIVLSGELKVTVWKKYGNEMLEDVTRLTTNMESTVEPGDEHMFEALDDTEALEIYYTELHGDDIVRRNHGGLLDDK